jgi:hypothetical protein
VEFVESPTFARQIDRLLPPEEYRSLQLWLAAEPEAGVRIRGGKGLRKLRWRGERTGKQGGIRIVYYMEGTCLYLLLAYAKTAQEDLTPSQLRALKRAVADL